MAIVVDSKAILTLSTGTTNTVAFTNTNGNILFVGLVSVGDVITSVTYGGDAMSKIDSSIQIPTNTGYATLWYRATPKTGNNNIVVNTSASVITAGAIVSYSGTNGTIDVSGNATVAGGTSLSKSLTTIVNNDWTVAFCATDAFAVSAGASTTLRQVADSSIRAIFDSNGSLAIGSNTLNVNFAGSSDGAIIMAAFKPSTAPGGSFLFQMI